MAYQVSLRELQDHLEHASPRDAAGFILPAGMLRWADLPRFVRRGLVDVVGVPTRRERITRVASSAGVVRVETCPHAWPPALTSRWHALMHAARGDRGRDAAGERVALVPAERHPGPSAHPPQPFPDRYAFLARCETAFRTHYDPRRHGSLVPPPPARGDAVVDVRWIQYPFARVATVLPRDGNPRYVVQEPALTARESEVLTRMIPLVRRSVSTEDALVQDVESLVLRKFLTLERREWRRFPVTARLKLAWHLLAALERHAALAPLLSDPEVDAVTCPGAGTPVRVSHRRHGVVDTDVVLTDADVAVVRRETRENGGRIPEVRRFEPDPRPAPASGPTQPEPGFLLRRLSPETPSLVCLVRDGVLPASVAAYLWMAVDAGRSIVVAGPPAAGKGALLVALARLLPPGARVVSVGAPAPGSPGGDAWIRTGVLPADADSPDGWLALTSTAPEAPDGADAADIVATALRQESELLVVGSALFNAPGVPLEVLGPLAEDRAFLAALDAGDVEDALRHLTAPGSGVTRERLSRVHALVHVDFTPDDPVSPRRVVAVAEAPPRDAARPRLPVRILYAWRPGDGPVPALVGTGRVLDAWRLRPGWSLEAAREERARREAILRDLARDPAVGAVEALRALHAYEPPAPRSSPRTTPPRSNVENA